MYTRKRIGAILLICSTVMFFSCNKESYIEGVGYASVSSNDPSNNNGTYTAYCTNFNIVNCSGGLNIYVDGVYKGRITGVQSFTPNCGVNTSTVCSITLSAGTHDISIYGSGSFCPRYATFTQTISRGQCYLQQLD